MTTAPFRAGRLPGEATPAAAAHAFLSGEASTSVTLLADISEFQPDLADAAYLAWSKAVIIRAAYGDAHDDRAWYGGARRDALHAGGAAFVGIYQYVVAGQDIAAQAAAMVRLVGKMRPGEKIIADIEEGAGNLQARWVQWADAIHAGLGDAPWDYSGDYFASAHSLAPVTWVASYGSAEPANPHQLWQFSDSYRVPGVGASDCSVYHGTTGQLAALAWQGTPAPAPAAHPVLRQGATGAAVVTLQQALNAHGAHLTADGDFGALTLAAVESFQAAQHLAADGVCGSLTWAALGV